MQCSERVSRNGSRPTPKAVFAFFQTISTPASSVFVDPIFDYLAGLNFSKARQLLEFAGWGHRREALVGRRIAEGISLQDLTFDSAFKRTYTALNHSSELSFTDRDLLFDGAFLSDSEEDRDRLRYRGIMGLRNFLQNPNHPPREMLAWILDKQGSEGLSQESSKEVKKAFADWVENARDLPAEERVAALETLGRKKEDPYRWLAEGDVSRVLADGRD